MKRSEGTMEEQMRQDAAADEVCPKCNALPTTPCAYPNFCFRHCPQRGSRYFVDKEQQ